ncbi:pterin deaminase [Comamonadaceae bacterium OS-1]|nr:pterin deaminase [Comamonadaceae bacterium OS-1]
MLLSAVAIPPYLRGFASDAPPGQAFDVVLDGPLVARIQPVPGPVQGTLLSAFVDAHVHLDKNYAADSVGGAEGDLLTAIARMDHFLAGEGAPTLQARMERGLADAYACGSRALRTHLNWDGATPPPSLAVFTALQEAWRGRLELQWVSLIRLDFFADAVAADAAARAVREGGGVLAAFVYRNANIEALLHRVFTLAQRYGLALDFHVDEGLDADATGVHSIARLTQAFGLQGRVVCGHGCSLSAQPAAQAQATLALCAQAGVHLVALPTTNLYLQGAWDATPQERGITRLKEALALGVSASIATDNVADAFYPYGSYDLFDSFSLGVQMAHLAPAQDALATITTHPAAALGLAWDGRIASGCPADLVLLAARNGNALLTPQGRQRKVVRAGVVLSLN